MIIFAPIMFLIALSPTIAYCIWFYKKSVHWDDRRKKSQKYVGYGILAINMLFLVFLGQQKKEEDAILAARAHQAAEAKQLQDIGETAKVANQVEKILREAGITSDLVITVEVYSPKTIAFVVTNTWLEKPRYEQKQLRQVFDQLLKKMYPPDGYDFVILDFLKNKI